MRYHEINEAESGWLYHATSLVNLKKIIKTGLRAGSYRRSNFDGYGDHSIGKIFFSMTASAAIKWADCLQGALIAKVEDRDDWGIVNEEYITVVVIRVPMRAVEKDYHGDNEIKGSVYSNTKRISPKLIQVWNPTRNAWVQLSAENIADIKPYNTKPHTAGLRDEIDEIAVQNHPLELGMEKYLKDFKSGSKPEKVGNLDAQTEIYKGTSGFYKPVWGDKIYFFLFRHGEPIGYVSLSEKYPHWQAFPHIEPKYRGEGLGLKLYKFILDQGYTLWSEGTQTVAGQKIWQALTKDLKYHVRMIDKNHDSRDIQSSDNPWNGPRDVTLIASTRENLAESPIADFGTYGSSEPGSFRPEDLRAMRNPKWVEKSHRMFSKCPFNFNIFFYNADENGIKSPDPKKAHWRLNPKTFDHVGHFEDGKVSRFYVSELLGRSDIKFDNAITLLLVNNEGDERFPLSPWIVAHRAIHMLLLGGNYTARHIIGEGGVLISHIADMLSDHGVPGYEYTAQSRHNVRKLIGTTAAQKAGVARPGEFYVEAGTQYIVQGRVRFAKVESSEANMIPEAVAENINKYVEEQTSKLNDLFRDLCQRSIGNCFIL